MQLVNNWRKPFDQLGVAIPKFIERPGLLSEYGEDRIRRIASIDEGGQRVVAEVLPCALLVLVQGCVEDGFEVEWCGGRTWNRGHEVIGGTWDVVSGRRKAKETSPLGQCNWLC